MYNNQTSIEHIESNFPEIFDQLHDEIVDGLLHLQMGAFSQLAQAAIDEKDKAQWLKVTNAFMALWKNCSPEVKNALNVSFLEHLNFVDGKKSRSWAYEVMPVIMRRAWDEMEDYNRKIHGG